MKCKLDTCEFPDAPYCGGCHNRCTDLAESFASPLDEMVRARQILGEKIPSLPQRQDSTLDQLNDLLMVGNKLGMYDAVDMIKKAMQLQF